MDIKQRITKHRFSRPPVPPLEPPMGIAVVVSYGVDKTSPPNCDSEYFFYFQKSKFNQLANKKRPTVSQAGERHSNDVSLVC